LTGKLINEKLLSKINIPIFHYSIIPSARQELKPQKNLLIFRLRRIEFPRPTINFLRKYQWGKCKDLWQGV
jgi:hypothetical protein